MKKKKLKQIYFGGTEEELIKVFEDMGALDTVFPYWRRNWVNNEEIDGFSYFTVDPHIVGLRVNEDPTNTGAVIAQHLAKELPKLPSLDPSSMIDKRRVWTLQLMMKKNQFAVIAKASLVAIDSSYTVSRRSTSLKLN